MPDEPLTNAAVETIRRFKDFNNKNDFPVPGSQQVVDDFRYEDRRTGGFNFGRLDASDMDAYVASARDVATGRMHSAIVEVIAVRGERSAAYVEAGYDGDDWLTEAIVCLRMDAELRRAERPL